MLKDTRPVRSRLLEVDHRCLFGAATQHLQSKYSQIPRQARPLAYRDSSLSKSVGTVWRRFLFRFFLSKKFFEKNLWFLKNSRIFNKRMNLNVTWWYLAVETKLIEQRILNSIRKNLCQPFGTLRLIWKIQKKSFFWQFSAFSQIFFIFLELV